jgi:hypothetical protein
MKNGTLVIGFCTVSVLSLIAIPFLALLWLLGAKSPFKWWFENIGDLIE